MDEPQVLLRELAADCWRLLDAAPGDRVSLARTPVLATAGADGAPECRTVVLRACDPRRRTLTVFTDARSPKVAQIAADPRVSMTFRDLDHAVQLRVWGTAALHADDGLARAHWNEAPPLTRRAYLAAPGPGQTVDRPMSGLPDGDADMDAGYVHFAVVVVTVRAVEWLRLERTGNLAARFEWDGDGLCGARWIVP